MVGPTWVSKVLRSGAGSAPERSTADQVLGLLLQLERIAEAAQRDAAARADAALDDRRAVDLVVEEDGHLAADVVARHLLGDRGALAVELEARPRGGRSAGPRSGRRSTRYSPVSARAPVQVVGAPVACRASPRPSSERACVLLVADLVIGRHRQVAGQARRRTSRSVVARLRRAGRRPRAACPSPSRSTTRARPRCPSPSWRPRGPADDLFMYSEPSSTILNSSCAVRPMIDLMCSKSAGLRPGSSTMMSVPFLMMVGSATPNLSTRLRMVSMPWRSA